MAEMKKPNTMAGDRFHLFLDILYLLIWPENQLPGLRADKRFNPRGLSETKVRQLLCQRCGFDQQILYDLTAQAYHLHAPATDHSIVTRNAWLAGARSLLCNSQVDTSLLLFDGTETLINIPFWTMPGKTQGKPDTPLAQALHRLFVMITWGELTEDHFKEVKSE